jgi:hypothetical protein
MSYFGRDSGLMPTNLLKVWNVDELLTGTTFGLPQIAALARRVLLLSQYSRRIKTLFVM